MEPRTDTASTLPQDRDHGAWARSRAGARAGRGFHYQDDIAAWFAARVAIHDLPYSIVIPEGYDDVTLAGDSVLHAQVKSRQPRLGAFSRSDVASYVVDLWRRHAADDESGLMLVLEAQIEGEHVHQGDEPMKETLSAESPLLMAVRGQAAEEGLDKTELERMLSRTSIRCVPRPEARNAAAEMVSSLANLPPAAGRLCGWHLTGLVASASDANADPDRTARRELTKTAILHQVHAFVEQVDVDALHTAMRDGVAESFDETTKSEVGERFYEGMSAQPSHVAAGLVVPRPDLTDHVVQSLGNDKAVVLTGPSGVGKSSVLWTLPHAAPGAAWFRLRRLDDRAVPDVLRLARAYDVAPDRPIGLLVDAAGTGDFDGWQELRREAQAVPGLWLVATARREDLWMLGDLADCDIVPVQLTETVASRIHGSLREQGVTTAPHWREAFEASGGLTMEFTHLLTRGQRLNSVVADQISLRIREQRTDELQILGLVCAAAQWSTDLPVDAVTTVCDLPLERAAAAMRRLVDEHLLTTDGATVSGLHPLRSRAVVDAIHSTPPPTVAATFTRVLAAASTHSLTRLITESVSDEPTIVSIIVEAAANETGARRLAGLVEGLRRADLTAQAREWVDICHQHDVPPALQGITIAMASLDNDPMSDGSLADVLDPRVVAATEAMSRTTPTAATERLLVELTGEHVGRVLAASADLDAAAALLASLNESRVSREDIAAQVHAGSALIMALRSAPLAEFADCLAEARRLSVELASHIEQLSRDDRTREQRFVEHDPWITKLRIEQRDDEIVAVCRFLHIDDEAQGDPRQHALALASLLNGAYPEIDRPDVAAVGAGGHRQAVAGHEHGISGLLRRYDRGDRWPSRNKELLRAAIALTGASHTQVLAEALPLLDTAADVIHKLGTILVTGRSDDDAARVTAQRWMDCKDAVDQLRPTLTTTPDGAARSLPALSPEPLAALLRSLTGHVPGRLLDPNDNRRALAAHLDKSVAQEVANARAAPWHLIGHETPPACLHRIDQTIAHLTAVLNEMSEPDADVGRLHRQARTGIAKNALQRAAAVAQKAARRRRSERTRELARRCSPDAGRLRPLRAVSDSMPLGVLDATFTIELETVLLWTAAVQQIHEAFEEVREVGERLTVIPLRQGRPVTGLAVQIIESALPLPDIDRLLSQLREPHSTELTTLFERCTTAMQMLSAIRDLPSPQQEAAAPSELAAAACERVATTMSAIHDRAEHSEVVVEIESVLHRHLDLVEDPPDGPGLAEAITQGILGTADHVEAHEILGCRLFAIEFDIDPTGADLLLREFDADA